MNFTDTFDQCVTFLAPDATHPFFRHSFFKRTLPTLVAPGTPKFFKIDLRWPTNLSSRDNLAFATRFYCELFKPVTLCVHVISN